MRRMTATVVAVVVAAAVLAGCDVNDLRLRVLDPIDGQIVSGSTVQISGDLPDYPGGGTVAVNGVPATVTPSGAWSATIPVDTGTFVTPYEVMYHASNGKTFFQRRAVVSGDFVAAGDPSPDGVGMQFTNAGLAGLGPVIEDLAGGAFDIGGLLASQNPVIQNQPVFLTFRATGNVYEAGIGSAGVAAQSTPTGVATTITVDDLYVGLALDITDNLLIDLSCALEIQIPTTVITAKFDLEPDPSSPSNVRVLQVGQPAVQTQGLSYEFISGICDSNVFLIGDIVNALAGPAITDLVTGGFQTALGSSGGSQGPIAEAIETALAGISVAGPVADALGVSLDAPFTAITETAAGITFVADADFAADIGEGQDECLPDPIAPFIDQVLVDETYDVPGAFPTLGATTPGGDPYGIGLTVSASAFNQLLGAFSECGEFASIVDEISLGGPPVPLTAGVLALLVPEFASLPPGTPMVIKTVPSMAPFITAAPGPNGEAGELFLANLQLRFFSVASNGNELLQLQLAVDAPLGLELAYDDVAGALTPTISPPAPADVTVRVIKNRIGANEAAVQAVFPVVFPTFVEGLSDSFTSFPLPDFLGFRLDVVEVARQGAYFVLYGNLDPVEQTRIENASLTDLSSGDAAQDSLFNVWEWRHRIRPKFSSQALSVDFKGMLGADSCCLLSDAERSATASYRLSFDVVPENGDTWQLDLDHRILGAHTLLDDGGGSADTAFTTAVTGRARIGGGAWQNFNFNATPSSTSSSGNVNTQFTGQNGLVLQGSTAQAITVEFAFSMRSRSNSTWITGGDEAAIRFGANDTIANGFTAGGYPGSGNRNIVNDGHFGTVELSTVP